MQNNQPHLENHHQAQEENLPHHENGDLGELVMDIRRVDGLPGELVINDQPLQENVGIIPIEPRVDGINGQLVVEDQPQFPEEEPVEEAPQDIRVEIDGEAFHDDRNGIMTFVTKPTSTMLGSIKNRKQKKKVWQSLLTDQQVCSVGIITSLINFP